MTGGSERLRAAWPGRPYTMPNGHQCQKIHLILHNGFLMRAGPACKNSGAFKMAACAFFPSEVEC